MARSLCDRIIDLANEVNRPIDRIEVRSWVRGCPRPTNIECQQALDDLERRGVFRQVRPSHQSRRGTWQPPLYELTHQHQREVAR